MAFFFFTHVCIYLYKHKSHIFESLSLLQEKLSESESDGSMLGICQLIGLQESDLRHLEDFIQQLFG